MKNLFLLLPFLLAGPVVAQENEDFSWGEHFYNQACSTCHGDDGKGLGELSYLLSVKVPDITTLSERNNGEFPMLHVIHVIDGRSGLQAHESPMPEYGAVFRRQLEVPMGMTGAIEPFVRGRVLSIAEHIQSLQQ